MTQSATDSATAQPRAASANTVRRGQAPVRQAGRASPAAVSESARRTSARQGVARATGEQPSAGAPPRRQARVTQQVLSLSQSIDRLSTVRTQGALLSSELLARVALQDGTLPGTDPASYHLSPNQRPSEVISAAWQRLRERWRSFRETVDGRSEQEPLTALTRERWLLPLFSELGYGRLVPHKAPLLLQDGSGSKSYPISHGWNQSPIHLLGWNTPLDARTAGVAGAAQASPHALVQDYLNRQDDALWGLLSNGRRLRLLRDHFSLTRQAYIEIDLEALMEGERYSDFALLWLLCHQSRLEGDQPDQCWLERWRDCSAQQGVRLRDKLRHGVRRAIEALGRGFLEHPRNGALRAALQAGDLSTGDYYHELLHLAYRLIFLFVAEDRGLLLDPTGTPEARSRYEEHYSTRRLRKLAARRRGSPHGDLWQGLRLVLGSLHGGCEALALPAFGGWLWASAGGRSTRQTPHGRQADARQTKAPHPELLEAECRNTFLLEALRELCTTTRDRVRQAVNWRDLDAEELGSVYESLLELEPELHIPARTFELREVSGSDRKSSGSYYTPAILVHALLDSALEPVLAEARRQPNPEAAILALKICDPACGSGHFLLAAARRVATHLARVRCDEAEPSPTAQQHALRDVIGHCIYGVDVNPMAVELCKVALWIEALEPGKPLSYLDAHLQCGDALLGATPALLAEGIPDEAFSVIEGDDKDVARRLKQRNRRERQGQRSLHPAFAKAREAEQRVWQEAQRLEALSGETAPEQRAIEAAWAELYSSEDYRRLKLQADAWCAAFVWPKPSPGSTSAPADRDSAQLEDAAPTHDTWRTLSDDPQSAPRTTLETVEQLARQHQFLHWHLAFPQVFGPSATEGEASHALVRKGGFDVVLGNPPWERIKLEEKQYFATRSPEVAGAPNAAARRRLIARIEQSDPALWQTWQAALRQAAGASHLLRNSGCFPLCGRGDINTYAVFAELNRALLHDRGRAGFIVPTGIATDDTTKHFFADLVERKNLASLLDFENRDAIFVGIDRRLKFALVTLAGARAGAERAELAFFLRSAADLADRDRRFSLSAEQIGQLNPNTRTCPIFRSRRDAEITARIYERVPVLWREGDEDGNPWGVSFRAMFHMSNDSGLFRTREQLEPDGWRLQGNIFQRGIERMLPLYEAKMVHHYDHRFGDYADKPADSENTALPEVPVDRLKDPSYAPLPRYWVAEQDVERRHESARGSGWLLGWRGITNATNMRSLVGAAIPLSAVGNSLPVIDAAPHQNLVGLVANLQTFVLDYVCRQKLGGSNFNFFILKQLPVLTPATHERACLWDAQQTTPSWIRERVLELTYTSHDLAPFARSFGDHGAPFIWDDDRRFVLRCELDAAFFHLYGITRDDAAYILDTFPIVRRQDEQATGGYRTKEAILEIYDALARAEATGRRYVRALNAPAARRHANRDEVPSRPSRRRPHAPVTGPVPYAAIAMTMNAKAGG